MWSKEFFLGPEYNRRGAGHCLIELSMSVSQKKSDADRKQQEIQGDSKRSASSETMRESLKRELLGQCAEQRKCLPLFDSYCA